MKDQMLSIPAGLNAAEAAVLYVLKRVRVDADLRWHMLHTEAFERLCNAEAQRTRKALEDVENQYGTPANDDKAKLPELRRKVEDLEARGKAPEITAAELSQALRSERNRCIKLIRHYLMFNDQRAFSYHEAQDCIDAIERHESPPAYV